jgi:Flp pilus assembly CpaE family ATPase
MNAQFETIEKEKIHSLQFPNTDVLEDKNAISQRGSELLRAQTLGNLEHSKIRIFFEDNHSKKVVETTVWGVTDSRVILKQGIGIPINRIYRSI